jgi:predicted TIM-barrel fold metal-dependent hydrolase
MSLVEELLRKGNWWILLANADRRSQVAPDFDDMLPIVRAIARMAPERAVWSTDWPHILYGNRPLPDAEKLLAFLLRTVPRSDDPGGHSGAQSGPALWVLGQPLRQEEALRDLVRRRAEVVA